MADNDVHKDAYKVVLEDLEKRKAQIEAAIASISSLMGDGNNLTIGTLTGTTINKRELGAQVEADSFFGLSLIEAAKKYLTMMKKPQSNTEIAEALQKGGFTSSSQNFKNTVMSVLHRHSKAVGEIVKVKKNWGLAEWYPGLRRTTKPSKGEAGNGDPQQEESPTDEEENDF